MAKFDGFHKETIKFLAGLARKNEKTWFDNHRADYENHLIEPAKGFVVAMGKELRKISKGIVAEPQINKAIRRINRDVRFSKDKSPYKTHLDMIFREEDSSGCGSSSFFLRMEAKTIWLGVGVHEFPKEALEKYRQAVVDKEGGPELASAIKKVSKAGYEVGSSHYKRVPRGFDPEHRNAEFLLYNALHAVLKTKVPPEFTSSKFVGFCSSHYKKVTPVHQWLMKWIG